MKFDKDDNIVKLIHSDSSISLTPKKLVSFCNHTKAIVDESNRKIFCANCNSVLDPFDFLWMWATKEDRIKSRYHFYKEKLENTRDRLDELLRIEKNARSRLKRLETRLKDEI